MRDRSRKGMANAGKRGKVGPMAGRGTVTVIDVARAANVSRTTASAALGGTGRISAETRARVQAVAAELGYRANPAARHLQGGRKGAIALYVPDNLTGYGFYMDFAIGAAEAAREQAFALTLLLRVAEEPITTHVAHVDGFLLVDPFSGDPGVPLLLDTGLPVVAAERYLGDERQPLVTVESEHREAFAELLDHLWERGARSPALLGIDLDFAWARLIEEVYLAWCADRGVAARVRELPVTSVPEEVRRIARALLDDPDPPDAIVAAPDGTALGVLGAVRDVGRTPGEDVLVASGVDSLVMQYAAPPITALDLRPREIGRDAANALLRLLRGEVLPPTIRRGRPGLVVRASTAGRVAAANA
jgi:DNA-binding LacI/PurR family transcriptional regulator